MHELENFLGTPGDAVPAVSLADFKAVWTYFDKLKSQHPDVNVGISIDIYQRLCAPGADIRAVWYRCTMFRLLEKILDSIWTGGHFSAAALKVAAQFPLEWMAVGTTRNGLPFNLDEFFAHVQAEAAGLTSPPEPQSTP